MVETSAVKPKYKIEATPEAGRLYITDLKLPMAKGDVVDLIKWGVEKFGWTVEETNLKISSSADLRSFTKRLLIKPAPPSKAEVHKGLSFANPAARGESFLKDNLEFVPAQEKVVNANVERSERPLENHRAPGPGKGAKFLPKGGVLKDVSHIKEISKKGLKSHSPEALKKMSVEKLNTILRNYGGQTSNTVMVFSEKVNKQVKKKVSKTSKVEKILEFQERLGRGTELSNNR